MGCQRRRRHRAHACGTLQLLPLFPGTLGLGVNAGMRLVPPAPVLERFFLVRRKRPITPPGEPGGRFLANGVERGIYAAVDTQGPAPSIWVWNFKIVLARCFSTILQEMPQRCATSELLSPSMRLRRKTVRHCSGRRSEEQQSELQSPM